MYALYKFLTHGCTYPLSLLLYRRRKQGKESSTRYNEKKGINTRAKPDGKLLWIHGASVGEAQSALILIEHILIRSPDIHILVTTGTLTSSKLMEKKLPENAFHQFYPLDQPNWVYRFLDHWSPDMVLWMESELWPNMLHQIKEREIPAALINARMSPKSFKSWKLMLPLAKSTLSVFDKVLCQTQMDQGFYDQLGAPNTITTDNLKHSAQPLTYNPDDLRKLQEVCHDKVLWLYASTHDGEEQIAHNVHIKLKEHYPDLLSIIVPRHPERRDEIQKNCQSYALKTTYRGENKKLPAPDDDIYVADTLGELGLFYELCPVACIGRSLSNDGGGGHNPIEAAQLGCGVIYGENIQNLQEIYDEMFQQDAALRVSNEDELFLTLKTLFDDHDKLALLQKNGRRFSTRKAGVIERVMKEIEPMLSVLQNDGLVEQSKELKKHAS